MAGDARAETAHAGAARSRSGHDDASERVRAVTHRAGALQRDLDPLEHEGIEKRRARSDAALRGDAGAVDQHEGSA